jgi:glucose-1-phosphate adenylyltransferase
VGTVQSYWEANMGLLEDPPEFDLYEPEWVIHTRSEERPPARILNDARVHRSLISHGCTIYGRVEHSVLSPGVYVGPNAVVKDSILMTDAVIERGAMVDRSILDKETRVGVRAVVGEGDPATPNRLQPERLDTGITILGKWAVVPAGTHIGRNCMIDAGVQESDYAGKIIHSGESILAHNAPGIIRVRPAAAAS